MAGMKNITLEDVRIVFRNFEGKEQKFNKAGDRNFAVLLNPDQADEMIRLGWNVKFLKAREEDEESQAYIPVSVSYKARPPKMVLITSRGMTYLSEEEIAMLDWVDIETADVTLNPYEWEVNDNKGVKAYVAGLYIKIVEDYLELKWQTWVDAQNGSITGAPADKDLNEGYIDADYYETKELESV